MLSERCSVNETFSQEDFDEVVHKIGDMLGSVIASHSGSESSYDDVQTCVLSVLGGADKGSLRKKKGRSSKLEQKSEYEL